MIVPLKNSSGNRCPIEVNIKDRHKNAHFQRSLFQDSVLSTFSYVNDLSIRWREDGIVLCWDVPPGVPEEKGNEQSHQDGQRGQDPPSHSKGQAATSRGRRRKGTPSLAMGQSLCVIRCLLLLKPAHHGPQGPIHKP